MVLNLSSPPPPHNAPSSTWPPSRLALPTLPASLDLRTLGLPPPTEAFLSPSWELPKSTACRMFERRQSVMLIAANPKVLDCIGALSFYEEYWRNFFFTTRRGVWFLMRERAKNWKFRE